MSDKPRSRRPGHEAGDPRTRLIRKYGNRRLYDTRVSRYVTLEDLVDVFASDEEVRVVDAVSGEDLTKKVLTQAILSEEGRRQQEIIPLSLLRTLLRYRDRASGEVYQRRVARAVADLIPQRRAALPFPPVANDQTGPTGSTELDDLRRRLQALERRIERR